MKSKIFVVLFLMIINVGCSINEGLRIDYMDSIETEEIVQNWIEKKSSSNGIYLGKVNANNSIYLYINYRNEENNQKYSVRTVGIDFNKNKLSINAIPTVSDETNEKIFVITEPRKKIKKIELNREEINLKQIEEI